MKWQALPNLDACVGKRVERVDFYDGGEGVAFFFDDDTYLPGYGGVFGTDLCWMIGPRQRIELGIGTAEDRKEVKEIQEREAQAVMDSEIRELKKLAAKYPDALKVG